MMPLIQFEREREDQANESRGQKEDLHATLAKMQLKKDRKVSLLQCCREGIKNLMKGFER
jgi:hypothetical protein